MIKYKTKPSKATEKKEDSADFEAYEELESPRLHHSFVPAADHTVSYEEPIIVDNIRPLHHYDHFTPPTHYEPVHETHLEDEDEFEPIVENI